MTSPRYEKLFELEKAQRDAFGNYYLDIQRAAREFSDRVHLLTGLPEETFKVREEELSWVRLYELNADGQLGPKHWHEIQSFEKGKLSFGVGLALSTTLASYPKQYYIKLYSLHSARKQMTLVDLEEEGKVFYIDTEEGLNNAAESFLEGIESKLLLMPETAFLGDD